MITEQKLVLAGSRRRVFNVATTLTSGPRLVLLHGVCRMWQDFLPLVPAFSSHWQVEALDLRGHGKSARASGSYRVGDYVDDVASWLRQGAEPVFLYGHSLGALVALGVAAEQPRFVRGIVLEDPPAPRLLGDLRATSYHSLFRQMQLLAGSSLPIEVIAGKLAGLRIDDPAGATFRLGDRRDMTSLRFSARCLRRLDPDVLTPPLENRWLDGCDLDLFSKSVRCPTLLLRGDDQHGGMLPAEDATKLVAPLQDGSLIDIPGVGHLLHWDATPEVIRHALAFLLSAED